MSTCDTELRGLANLIRLKGLQLHLNADGYIEWISTRTFKKVEPPVDVMSEWEQEPVYPALCGTEPLTPDIRVILGGERLQYALRPLPGPGEKADPKIHFVLKDYRQTWSLLQQITPPADDEDTGLDSAGEIRAVMDWLQDNHVEMLPTPGGMLEFKCKETGDPAVLPALIWRIADKRLDDLWETVRPLKPKEKVSIATRRRAYAEKMARTSPNARPAPEPKNKLAAEPLF